MCHRRGVSPPDRLPRLQRKRVSNASILDEECEVKLRRKTSSRRERRRRSRSTIIHRVQPTKASSRNLPTMRCKHLSQQSYFHNQNYIHRRKRSSSSSCSETATCSALLPQPALNHSPIFKIMPHQYDEKAKQQQQDLERRAPFFIGFIGPYL